MTTKGATPVDLYFCGEVTDQDGREPATALGFACPKCGHGAYVLVDPPQFRLREDGLIRPDFVCINRPGGRYCDFAGPVRIT